MTTRQRRNKIAGFTLLEALIATALMGMSLAALATITAQWLPNWNRGMVRVQRNENIALGLERIAADLAAATFIPTDRDSKEPYFEGSNRSVTFVRMAVGPNTKPGLEIVRLAEVSSEEGPLLVRTRAPFTLAATMNNNGISPHFGDPVILMRPPYRISFSYAGSDRIWREAWQQQVELPKAVKLTMHDAAKRQTLPISTAALVHARVPAACIDSRSFKSCFTAHMQPSQSAAGNKSYP